MSNEATNRPAVSTRSRTDLAGPGFDHGLYAVSPERLKAFDTAWGEAVEISTLRNLDVSTVASVLLLAELRAARPPFTGPVAADGETETITAAPAAEG